jgi:hypothetical protein
VNQVQSQKRKTVGVDPKVPIQAVVTAAVAVLAYFGIDLDPALAGAIAVVIGIIAGFFSPAPKTEPVVPATATVEGGTSHLR